MNFYEILCLALLVFETKKRQLNFTASAPIRSLLKSLLCIITLLIAAKTIGYADSTNQTADSRKEVNYIKRTFRYGTWEQQLAVLTRYEQQKYSGKNKAAFLKLLAIPAENIEDDRTAQKLFTVISQYKLTNLYPKIGEYLLKTTAGAENYPYTKTALITSSLKIIARHGQAQSIPIVEQFFTNIDLHKENPNILAALVNGVGRLKMAHHKAKLRPLFDRYESEPLRIAVLNALASFKDEQDIPFFESVIFDYENLGNFIKWNAVTGLKEYAPSKQALSVLQECYETGEAEFKARALHAMSFFKIPKFKKQLIKASKAGSTKIRLQAIRGLKQYKESDVDELLLYRQEFDPEAAVRFEAGKILKEREREKTDSTNTAKGESKKE